jgi:hypothetical protein
MTGFLFVTYLFVAAFAACMTYFEQKDTGSRSPVFRALGFLACALWPLTVVVVAFMIQRQSPSGTIAPRPDRKRHYEPGAASYKS